MKGFYELYVGILSTTTNNHESCLCHWPTQKKKKIYALTLFPFRLRVSHKRQAGLCQDSSRISSSAVGAADVIRLHGRKGLCAGDNSLV